MPAAGDVERVPLARSLARGARLRCPTCGRAPLFRAFFQAHDTCPACGRRHASDRGDWVGGAEITLLLTSPALILGFLALRRWTEWTSGVQLALLLAAAVVLVPLVYRRVKGAWIGLVHAWEGDAPTPPHDADPEWFTQMWARERDEPQTEDVRFRL